MIRFVMGAAAALAMLTPAVAQDMASGDAAAGETVFKRCAACHAVGEGARNKVGPQLNGIMGRPAASVDGFNYSAAMKERAAAGLVWTEETLHPFLENPRGYIPGTKMAFAGLKNEVDRANVIAYLRTFSPDYVPAGDGAAMPAGDGAAAAPTTPAQ